MKSKGQELKERIEKKLSAFPQPSEHEIRRTSNKVLRTMVADGAFALTEPAPIYQVLVNLDSGMPVVELLPGNDRTAEVFEEPM